MTRIMLLAMVLLCLTSCASGTGRRPPALTLPVSERLSPPAELLADCRGAEEITIGDALQNRAAVIACERENNARLRAWAAN